MKVFVLTILLTLSSLHAQWMKGINGNIKLSELSIPGTHNTCARFGGMYAECQTLTLEKQLEAGIRFLDIRCRHINDDFKIYHGIMSQHTSFTDVQKTCLDFLKKNPSESIIMSIQKENSDKGNKRKFGETFKALISKEHYYQATAFPKLKDVRGKIVIVSRNHEVAGIPWKSLCIQDRYKVSGSSDIEKKWGYINTQFKASREDKKNQWFINFCTGNGFFSTPATVAKSINPRVEALIKKELKEKKTLKLGTVVLDFPEQSLIDVIIEANENVSQK